MSNTTGSTGIIAAEFEIERLQEASKAKSERIAELEKELRDNRADSYAAAAANATNVAAYWVKRCEELKEQVK